MAATASSSVNAFQRVDKSNSAVYSNRNGQVSFVAASLPSVVSQNWIPSVDNTYDLGENGTPRRWRDLWLSRNASVVGQLSAGSATITGNLVSAGTELVGAGGLRVYNNAVPDIGASSARFGTGYFTALNASTTLNVGGLATLQSLAVTSTTPSSFGGIIMPSGNATTDIGTNQVAWKDLYITGNIYKNNILYNPALTSLGDLIPSADNTYIIGQRNGLRWKTGDFYGNIYTVVGNINTGSGSISADNGSLWAGNGTVTGGTVTGNNLISAVQCSPSVDNAVDLGQSATRWRNLYLLTANVSTVQPGLDGAPVAGTTIGTSTRVYQYGYIDNLNSVVIVPRAGTSGSSTIGAGVNRFNNGYFTNLDVTNLTVGALSVSSLSTSTSTRVYFTPVISGYSVAGVINNASSWYRIEGTKVYGVIVCNSTATPNIFTGAGNTWYTWAFQLPAAIYRTPASTVSAGTASIDFVPGYCTITHDILDCKGLTIPTANVPSDIGFGSTYCATFSYDLAV